MHKIVVALYDSRADAQEARGELERAGYRPADSTGYGAEHAGQGGGIPLVEERPNIRKRSVERGGVRVRRSVVNAPVQEQVDRRNETVGVQGRPVTQQSPDHQNRGSRTDSWGMVPGEPAFQEHTMRHRRPET